MKICFVCPEYPPGPHGGVGTFTQVLARALVNRGHAVRVVGVHPRGYPAPDYEEDQGVRVWRLRESSQRLGWISDRRSLFRTIRGWAEAGEIDLVEAPDSNGWYAWWPKLPVPLVTRSNGSYTYFAHELGQRAGRVVFLLERASMRRSDAWASVSRHTGVITQKLFGLNRGPDAVLYNQVEKRDLPAVPAARNRNLVVFTGTLTRKKGVVTLIEAWPFVKKEFPAAELRILGKDGRTENGESMQQFLAVKLPPELAGSVSFQGHVGREHLLKTLSEARVGVFPSYTEAFGLAPVEAMICGCPTIYSKLSCGPEIVRDGIDGLLVDPDRPEEIARAVCDLLRDDAKAELYGKQGRERALAMFTIDTLLPVNEEFYRKVTASFAERMKS